MLSQTISTNKQVTKQIKSFWYQNKTIKLSSKDAKTVNFVPSKKYSKTKKIQIINEKASLHRILDNSFFIAGRVDQFNFHHSAFLPSAFRFQCSAFNFVKLHTTWQHPGHSLVNATSPTFYTTFAQIYLQNILDIFKPFNLFDFIDFGISYY